MTAIPVPHNDLLAMAREDSSKNKATLARLRAVTASIPQEHIDATQDEATAIGCVVATPIAGLPGEPRRGSSRTWRVIRAALGLAAKGDARS